MENPKEICYQFDDFNFQCESNPTNELGDGFVRNNYAQQHLFQRMSGCEGNVEPQTAPFSSRGIIPKRHVIALMILISNMNLIFLQMNTVMVLAEITTHKNVTSSNESSVDFVTDLNWNSKQKGIILSTYSYGRLLCPVAGLLAAKIGGSTTCSIANLVMATITFASPFIYENTSFMVVVSSYAILGVFEGFLFGGIPQLLSRWAPPNERSRFAALNTMGLYCGAIVSFMTSGWILQTWGRNVLFYSSGCVSFLWFWIWLLVVRNDPSEDAWISNDELRYIQAQLVHASVSEKLRYPWRSILSCVPFWCNCSSHFMMAFANTFVAVSLPQFMKDTYNIDIRKIGYLSTIPQISALTSMLLCGILCDYIRSKKILPTTYTHILFNCISLFVGFFAFLLMALKPSFSINIVAVVMFEFCSAFAMIDVTVLLLDLSRKYVAFLEATSYMWANCAVSVAPIIVAFVVTSHSQLQWGVCFYGMSMLHLLVALFYLKFFPRSDAKCSLERVS